MTAQVRGDSGLGVVDVCTEDAGSADLVTGRIRLALDTLPAGKLIVNPDCGLCHLPADVARAKLCAMVEGTAAVRGTCLDAVALRPATAEPTEANPPEEIRPRTDPRSTFPEASVEQGAR